MILRNLILLLNDLRLCLHAFIFENFLGLVGAGCFRSGKFELLLELLRIKDGFHCCWIFRDVTSPCLACILTPSSISSHQRCRAEFNYSDAVHARPIRIVKPVTWAFNVSMDLHFVAVNLSFTSHSISHD